MPDWKSTDHDTSDRRPDGRARDDARSSEPRQFSERAGQDRSEGQGAWGPRASEDRGRLDSGAGDQGEDRYGHSGGFQTGYGGQSGKAGWGPLSQGSTYGQGGPGYGHSGWSAHPNASDGPRGQGPGAGGDHGRTGGGGQERSSVSGGSYGQGDHGDSARRSFARTTQYDSNDREGFVAYGRGYGDSGREPDHDHEPAYRDWREHQLSGHDQDYRRWRDEQARRYDEDYRAHRASRHEAFSKTFQDWRSGQARDGKAPDQPSAAAGEATASVRNVADGGEGRSNADADKRDGDKTH